MAVAASDSPFVLLDEQDVIVGVAPVARAEFEPLLGRCRWDCFPGSRVPFRPHYERARRTGEPVELVQFFAGHVARVRAVPEGKRLELTWESLAVLDVLTIEGLRSSLELALALLDRRCRRSSLRVLEGGRCREPARTCSRPTTASWACGAVSPSGSAPGRQDPGDARGEPAPGRGRASASRASATLSTSARVSASSSLSARSSTACASPALAARTRSLTVVSVSSAMRRRRGSDGEVTPRSQRDTVIGSTPSRAASCAWVSPARRLAARIRPPTPLLSRIPPMHVSYHSLDGRAASPLARSPVAQAHPLPAALAALVALGQEERPLAARQAMTEEPAAKLHASSGPTRTSILPMFSPRRRPRNARGAFSIPSITVSR